MDRLHWRYLGRYRAQYHRQNRALFTYLGCHVAQRGQGKYNMCHCRRHYRGRYRANFRQCKHIFSNEEKGYKMLFKKMRSKKLVD
jgi:hypothetical protein